MSTIGGANIIQDGLVFGYDADDRSTRYYPGEPTTNMVTNTDLTTWSENDTVLTENGMVNIDHHSFMSYKLTTDTGNSTHRLYAGQGAILSTSTNYNISLYAKANGYNYITFGMTDNTYYQTQTTFNLLNGDVELDYTSSGGTIIDSSSNYIGKGWYRLNLTISLSTYITANYFLMMVLDSVKNPPQTSWTSDGVSGILVSSPQIELKSHTTPYTPTSRSSTQGLLDLTGNNTIDLSNVSFDSTAHPELDGVDDFIDTSYSSGNILTPTYESWIYDTKNNASYRSIIQINSASDDALYISPTNYLYFYPETISSLTVSSNQWVYVAATYDGTNITYCVNGEFQTFSTGGTHITDVDYIRIGGHSTGDSERWKGQVPIVRVHNRPLSQVEMLNNFNAHRNRFGI